MTERFVPGGPEPITKGLGIFSPSTVVARVGIGKNVTGEEPADVGMKL